MSSHNGGMNIRRPELEKFLSQLQVFDGELGESVRNLGGHLDALGQSWQDEQYDQFREKFDKAATAMKAYLDDSPQRLRFLRQKLDAVDDYLRG